MSSQDAVGFQGGMPGAPTKVVDSVDANDIKPKNI